MRSLRVVSLCPSITETVVALGALESLVGATRFCVRPRGVLRGLPRVGGTKDPDVDRIRRLAPDLVLANEEENRREDVEALRESGIEVDVSFPRKVREVPVSVRRLGELLGRRREAEKLASGIEAELARVTALPPRPPLRYAYWIWRDPWMTVSGDTYVADLLSIAGGVDVFGEERDRYPTTTPEESLARGAEVQIFPSEPYPFREARHGRELAELFGSDSRRVFVEGDDFCWHGARTLEGLRAAAKLAADLDAFSRAGSGDRGTPPGPGDRRRSRGSRR